MMNPDVQVSLSSSGWRACLRPAGPAGCLIARLPFGITVWLDAAEPWLALEVIDFEVEDIEISAALTHVLYGEQAAARVVARSAGPAAYTPVYSDTASKVRKLLAKLATESVNASLGTFEVTAYAHQLHTDLLTEGTDLPLARLISRIAVSWAARAVAVSRLLPDRRALRLDGAAEAALDRGIELVRRLVGDDVGMGSVATPSDGPLAGSPPIGVLESIEVRPADSIRLRNDPRLPPGRVVSVAHCSLPVRIDEIVVSPGSGAHISVTGAVEYGSIDERGEWQPVLGPLAASTPEVWARAIRRADRAVLYAAQCLLSGSDLRATLYIDPDTPERSYWIELADGPDAPVLTPHQARAGRAERLGSQATAIQRDAFTAQQWARAGALWLNCADLWQAADDTHRTTLAAIHATRAYLAAGPEYANAATSAARMARSNLAVLDPQWLAPSLACQARRDELDQETLIGWSHLGKPMADWVSDQLNNVITGPVPDLRPSYLRRMLVELPAIAGIQHGRIRLLRARARVALAHQACQQIETLPLASVLMAAASAEWPYLDGTGRQRYAAVNLALLEAETARSSIDPLP